MTDASDNTDDLSETAGEDRLSDPMSALLRHALPPTPALKKSFLPDIQQKIRLRTRGRYYRDRFSRGKNPVSFLLMATLLVLVLCAALFLGVQPLVDSPTETQLPSPPEDPLGMTGSPESAQPSPAPTKK